MKKVIFTMAFAAIAFIGYSQNAPANQTKTTSGSTTTMGTIKQAPAAKDNAAGNKATKNMDNAKQAPAAKPAAPATPGTDKDTGEKTKDGLTIYMGPKGGKYYIKDGKKHYIQQNKPAGAKTTTTKSAPAPKKAEAAPKTK